MITDYIKIIHHFRVVIIVDDEMSYAVTMVTVRYELKFPINECFLKTLRADMKVLQVITNRTL